MISIPNMARQYIILKNGKPMNFEPRPLDNAIHLVRELEKGLDRLKQHSPYTIDFAAE